MIDPTHEPRFRSEYWTFKQTLLDYFVRPFSVAMSTVVGAGVGVVLLEVAWLRLRSNVGGTATIALGR
jgi:hypothetical protein